MASSTEQTTIIKNVEESEMQKSAYTLLEISSSKEKSIADPAVKEIINLSRPRSLKELLKSVKNISKLSFSEPKNKDSGLLENEEGNIFEKISISESLKYDNVHEESPVKSRKSLGGELYSNKLLGFPENSKAKVSASQNIVVLNMKLDIPSSETLPSHEAEAIAGALQQCLDVLKVLQYTIPAKVDLRWDENYKTLAEKYGDPDDAENIFREDMGLLPLIPTVAEKLQRDRTYIYNVLDQTRHDIKKNRRFDHLKVEVEKIANTIEQERALQLEYEMWLDLVKQLQDLIASQNAKNEEEMKECTELARNVDIEADNSIFLNSSKLEYVKRWEEDRLNQQHLKMALEEQKIVDELNENGKRETVERLVSEDIQAFLNDNIVYLENKIKYWHNRYNEDIVKKQREIYELKEAIDERKENLQELYTLYAERQAFIDECYAEKERIKREEEYWKTMNRAATLIQSIWRGYMVRNQLGEYQELSKKLRKRKKLAAVARKKREAWQKKKAKQWGDTKLKTMKNIVDPNA